MITYNWRCDCGEITDVERKMADYDVPPEACAHCGGSQLAQVILRTETKGVKQFILIGDSGWHHTEYTATRSIK